MKQSLEPMLKEVMYCGIVITDDAVDPKTLKTQLEREEHARSVSERSQRK